MASVVVAEDNADHRRIISEVVRRLGHDVTVTPDGRAGLAAVVEKQPDLVIADLDMPYLDGLQLCRAVRANPELAGIPVVLVTAYVPPTDRWWSIAGVTAVVHKPFSVAELNAALRPFLAPIPFTGSAGADPAFVQELLRSLDTGVAACDLAGRLVVFNDVMRDLFGDLGEAVPVDEWPNRYGLRHHDGRPVLVSETALGRALKGEHVRDADLFVHDAQGRPRWFTVNSRPIRDANGAMLGAVAAMHDVTAEHRAEQYQACKAEVMRVLAGNPDDATAGAQVVHAVGSALNWQYVRLWLVEPVSGLLRPSATYTAPGERPLPIPDGVARGQGLAGRCWERGELIWVPDIHAVDSPVLPEVTAETTFRAAGAVPVKVGDHISGVLSFFSHSPQEPEPGLATMLTGIAGTVGAHLQRRRADTLTQHLAAANDEYIALVGHELRTPLTSIGSYAEVLAESPDDTPIGEVRDLIEVIERNSARLRTIVERLLDLAALESGHAVLERGDVDLVAVVTAVVDAIEERDIAVRTNLPAELVVTGDAERIRQVVDHLLDNAIKFSPDGSTVMIALNRDAGSAVLTVVDSGIGVPADAAPHLFRRLFRADNARHTRMPGAGLGLALCRVVVERMHGSITVSGDGDRDGTTVTVRVPARALTRP